MGFCNGLLLPVFLFTSYASSGDFHLQDETTTLPNAGWVQLNDFAFPVFVVSNSGPRPNGMQLRKIFIFIDSEHFVMDNLLKVFGKLRGEYKEPALLSITNKVLCVVSPPPSIGRNRMA